MSQLSVPLLTLGGSIAPPRPLITLKIGDGSPLEPLQDLYERYKTPAHMAGGALLAAGIARLAGAPGEILLSAAGSGAFAGWMAGESSREAVLMGLGAIVGASIATMAGVPGVQVLGAAGVGTWLGWLVA